MSNRMWGGRFASGPAEIMEEINASIGFDKRLAPPGHRAARWPMSRCWAQAGILPAEDVAAIQDGLKADRATRSRPATSRSGASSRTST